MFSKTVAAFTALAAVANGHMLMNTPSPYTSPALQNGPLKDDGSNFPCQLTAGSSLSGGTTNTYELGSTNSLKFTGSAVHGGGSCQISITYDEQPSASSTWKVIRSIEGGCPAQDQDGNMGDNANAVDPYTYNFTVPTNIPTGKVTLAWTWFNKIGNREMYMNCAPVSLTGTSGDKSNFDKLPDMFTANIGNGCSTEASKDLKFPDPGQDVIQLNGATSAFAPPVGSCTAGAGSGSGSGSSTAAGSSPATATPTASAGAGYGTGTTSAAAGAGTGSVPGGVFATVSESSTPSATGAPAASAPAASAPAASAPAASAPAASAPAASAPAASAPAASSPAAGTSAAPVASTPATSASTPAASGSTGSGSTTGTQQTPGSACTTEGAWNCLGSKFQQCASGTWSALMNVAEGTACSGSGSTFAIAGTSGKRSVRLARGVRAVPFRA